MQVDELIKLLILTLMKKIIKKPSTPHEDDKQIPTISDQNFKIYLRMKPPMTQEPNSQVLKIVNSHKVQITSPYYSVNEVEKVYTYEEVFDEGVNNCRVFQQTMVTPIANVLQGFNSTVFIYGMTGSGKTYTMFGSLGSGTNRGRSEEEGLVSMTLDYMFDQIQKQSQIKSQIVVSFYEIYNENIRDLLQQQQQPLTIMEDPIRGVFINGLTQVTAQDKNQIKDVIYSGVEKRSMNATRSNEVSSRSHAILQFAVKRFMTSNDEAMVTESKFFMIDLAGNQKTSHNESRRFIQGVNINKSLLTLGKCLSILADRKAGYVPFRDSKLTRILKQSLGGNSKTVMIACVSSQRRFYQQTLNTLKYSTIAKKIKNKGVKNNLKLISKQQIPDSRNFVHGKMQPQTPSDVQKRIKEILGTFLTAVETKLKIEKLQQDLETSRKENEQLLATEQADSQMCRRNIKKINDTLQLILRPYEKQLEKLQYAYHQLMENINQIIKQKNLQRNHRPQPMPAGAEISRLKQIIAEQNRKLCEYEHKISSYSDICIVEPQHQQFEHQANKSLQCRREITLGSPHMQKQNSVPLLNTLSQLHLAMGDRSHSRNKKLTINCGQDEQSSRCSPLKALNISNNASKGFDRKSTKIQREIVINLNSDHIEKSTHSHHSSKEEFVRRLKQTEKKAKGAQSEEVTNLLKEQQLNRYNLGNVEMSMIRKLKFFQRERTIEKSSSLGKMASKSREPIRFNPRRY